VSRGGGSDLRLLVTADAVGGVWSYALDLARGLSRKGVHTLLAVMGPAPSAAQERDATAIAGLELAVADFRLEWMDDPWLDVDRAGKWLQRLATTFGADLVHLNGYSHAVLPFGVPVVVVCHSCVLSWWQAVHGEPAPARYDEYRARVRSGIERADWVVAPTRAMLHAVQELHGAPRRTSVISNGAYVPKIEASRKEPLALAAGRVWDQAKHIALLAEIAPTLGYPLYVAGDTSSPEGRHVEFDPSIFLGALERQVLAQWMAKASVFAHPARYEPFGLAPLEAAASGAALVLSDIPSLREVWDDAAVYVPVDDRAAWRDVLRELLEDRDRARALGSLAAARAMRFSAELMARRYLRLYELLLHEASSGVDSAWTGSEQFRAQDVSP
jgi:glycosyltransferase involved in cell wall biosynthesis